MEVSVVITEGVDRELVMAYVWENVVDHFVEGNYRKAQVSYNFYEILERMTDEEYTSSCVCTDQECPCHP